MSAVVDLGRRYCTQNSVKRQRTRRGQQCTAGPRPVDSIDTVVRLVQICGAKPRRGNHRLTISSMEAANNQDRLLYTAHLLVKSSG